MVEVRPISFCMPILKANTYNLKKSTHFYLLYEESYNRLKLTYFSRTSAFTLDAHCTRVSTRMRYSFSRFSSLFTSTVGVQSKCACARKICQL